MASGGQHPISNQMTSGIKHPTLWAAISLLLAERCRIMASSCMLTNVLSWTVKLKNRHILGVLLG